MILPQYCVGTEVFRIDAANGSIAQVAGSPFPIPIHQGPEVAESVAVDPLDRWVFIDAQNCDSGCSNITETYALNKQTGALSFLEYGNGGCGNYNRIDPSGKFLYSIGPELDCGFGDPTTILGLAINQSNGSLTDVPGSPFPFTTNSANPGQVGLVITP